MTSYHEYNKYDKAKVLVEKLLAGENVALITDAGTPAISDPGEELVRQCLDSGITVTPVPGACACVNALIVSGLPTRRFCFEAFLPTDKKERALILESWKTETRTIVLYEAPHRLLKTLQELYEQFGNRRITVCRELTKKHETVFRTRLEEAVAYYTEHEPKGECVIVMEGVTQEALKEKEQEEWRMMDIEEHMEHYLRLGMDKKAAMKQVASDRGVSRREIYQALLDR